MNILNLIDRPQEWIEFVNKTIRPKEREKKLFGEVFTPLSLVNEMLDKMPKHVWKNKNLKWLEPGSGLGNFSICVYLRLMKGLRKEIKSRKERKKHILENMIYMCELNPKNVMLCKMIMGGRRWTIKNETDEGWDFEEEMDYNLNIYEGDFLE